MKRILGLLLIVMTLFGLTACGNDNETAPSAPQTSRVLIVYFSCTNTTENIAKHIQTETKGTLYEIIPEVLTQRKI